MFNGREPGTFVYLSNIYTFPSVLQSMAQSLLQPGTTPVMHGRSFIYASQGADFHYLLGYTVFSGKAGNTVARSKLFSSWLPGPCFFNIISWCAESSSFFLLSKRQGERSGKQSKCCGLKSCRVKCLHSGECRMLQHAYSVPQRGVLGVIHRWETDRSLWSHRGMGLMWVLVASAVSDFLSFQRVWVTYSFCAGVLFTM